MKESRNKSPAFRLTFRLTPGSLPVVTDDARCSVWLVTGDVRRCVRLVTGGCQYAAGGKDFFCR